MNSFISQIVSSLPGVGSLSASQQEEFWSSFLSSLYSGVVSGLVTGMVVGLVVYLVQKSFEGRELRRRLESESSVFRERVRALVGRAGAYSLDNLHKVPDYVSQLMGLVEGSPIDYWRRNTRTNEAIFTAVKKVQDTFFQFQVAATHLDSALKAVIRRHNAQREAISANDPYIYGYFTGRRLNNMSEADIFAWLDISQNARPWIEAGFSELQKDVETQRWTEPYLEQRKKLENAVSELRNLLGVPSLEMTH